MYISEIRTSAPTDERMPLERKMYDTLDKLKIPYEQVDNNQQLHGRMRGNR